MLTNKKSTTTTHCRIPDVSNTQSRLFCSGLRKHAPISTHGINCCRLRYLWTETFSQHTTQTGSGTSAGGSLGNQRWPKHLHQWSFTKNIKLSMINNDTNLDSVTMVFTVHTLKTKFYFSHQVQPQIIWLPCTIRPRSRSKQD